MHKSISRVREPLLTTLISFYRVNGESFEDIAPLDACRHMSFHLTKLISKYTDFAYFGGDCERAVVEKEVAPDLLIYSQELMIKFSFELWPTPTKYLSSDMNLRQLMDASGQESRKAVSEIQLSLVRSAAALADICDNSDHNQKSPNLIKEAVAAPLVFSARDIIMKFNIDIDAAYFSRLDDMREKYLRWML